MMRLGTLLLAVVLFSLSAHAGEGGTLIVKVTNLRSDRGQVVACLYRNEDGFPKDERKAWRRGSAPIAHGVAEMRFVGVPPGTYAVLAFHDENGNGVLERSFLGIPKEGMPCRTMLAAISGRPSSRTRDSR
jgi:uncharacterized protein (DUF2141 family)